MAEDNNQLKQEVVTNLEEGIESKISQAVEKKEKYTKTRRYLILLLVSIAGMASPICSAIYLPSLLNIKNELNTTEELVDITVSSFLFIMAIAPLIWGSIADMYGRRGVNIYSMLIFALSSIGCALAYDINFLIVMRALQGLGSSATLVSGIGTISDIFPKSELGSASSLFLIGPFIGPVIGPTLGGFINQYLGWRYIFWILTGLAFVLLICVILFLPETLPAERKQEYPFKINFKPFKITRNGPIFNPLQPLFYLKYITVLLNVLYSSIIFASYYSIASSQVKFLTSIYNLNSSQVGLCYLPLGVGSLVGSLFGGRLSDFIVNRYTLKTNDPAPPEISLYICYIGAISITAGLFMLGWFLEFKLPLSATLISQSLVGFGMTLVFSGSSVYLINLFPKYASSIAASSNLIRTISAAIVASFNSVILKSLNFSWTFSMFGFLQLVGIFILVVFTFYGAKIRTWENSK